MISIHQLHKEIDKREKQKNNTYQTVLNKCHYRIITTNSKSNDCYCLFVVPTFLFGVPLYDMTKCIIFVMENLIHYGFKVVYTHPNLLYISWKEKPKNEPQSITQTGLIDNNYNQQQPSIYHSTDIKTLEFKTDNLFL